MNITQDLQTIQLINGVTYNPNTTISLNEIKATVLQYLGVPRYSSLNGFKTPVTVFGMNNVTGSNVYRWDNFSIVIEITYNETEIDFQVIITKNDVEDVYHFSNKDVSSFGYYGFLNRLTNLLEF